MGAWLALPIVGKVIEGIISLVDKVVPDTAEANRIKSEITKLAYSQDHDKFIKLIEEQTKIILAEAQGSWIQRNWRPLLMMVIVVIIANNYVFFPYAKLFFPNSVVILELPEPLWNLMNIGVGGYVVGRTAEKSIEAWKKAEGK